MASKVEGRVVIEFGVVPNGFKAKGGFLPVYWVNGKQHGTTYASLAFDAEYALFLAKKMAFEEAEKFAGDWDISIAPFV